MTKPVETGPPSSRYRLRKFARRIAARRRQSLVARPLLAGVSGPALDSSRRGRADARRTAGGRNRNGPSPSATLRRRCGFFQYDVIIQATTQQAMLAMYRTELDDPRSLDRASFGPLAAAEWRPKSNHRRRRIYRVGGVSAARRHFEAAVRCAVRTGARPPADVGRRNKLLLLMIAEGDANSRCPSPGARRPAAQLGERTS